MAKSDTHPALGISARNTYTSVAQSPGSYECGDSSDRDIVPHGSLWLCALLPVLRSRAASPPRSRAASPGSLFGSCSLAKKNANSIWLKIEQRQKWHETKRVCSAGMHTGQQCRRQAPACAGANAACPRAAREGLLHAACCCAHPCWHAEICRPKSGKQRLCKGCTKRGAGHALMQAMQGSAGAV